MEVGGHDFFEQPTPFDRIDVAKLGTVHRTLNLVEYAQGTALFIKGRSMNGEGVGEGLRTKYLQKGKFLHLVARWLPTLSPHTDVLPCSFAFNPLEIVPDPMGAVEAF